MHALAVHTGAAHVPAVRARGPLEVAHVRGAPTALVVLLLLLTFRIHLLRLFFTHIFIF
jgi:hypothetical protein